MAIAVRITPSKMTKADYDKVMGDLEASGEPDGRVFHASYGDDEVHMFEVWDSRESFAPHQERLMTALQDAGVDSGAVEVATLHRSA